MPGTSPSFDVTNDSDDHLTSVDPSACPKKNEEAEPNPILKNVDVFFQNLTARNKEFAIKLHKATYIYAVYGALDGLSLSYSMVKYLFDLQYTSSSLSSDAMHDWMLTKEGMFAVGIESVTLIAFSLLANIFKDDDKNAFKRYIATLWPYCRDSMKGLKNAYKGIRSTLLMVGNSQLGAHDLSNMVVPVGIALGLISAANRICMRKYVYEPRKAMMKENTEALAAVQAIKFFDTVTDDSAYNRAMVENFNAELFRKGYEYCLKPSDDLIEKNKLYFKLLDAGLEYTVIDPLGKRITATINKDKLKEMGCELKAPLTIAQLKPYFPAIIELTSREKHTYRTLGIQHQSERLRSAALLGSAYGGVVDGLYLFVGAMSIGIIPAFFIPMAVLSVIFTVTCIATRVYEEWDFQRKLLETQAKIELALCGKEIEVLFAKMQLLTLPPDAVSTTTDIPPLPAEIKAKQDLFLAELQEKMKDFDTKMKYLRSQMNLSQTSAALAGLRNGLAAYNAIASFMFAIVTIAMLLSTTLPPVFILACAIAGMVCLIGFMSYSLYYNNKHLKTQKPLSADSHNLEKINDLVKSIKAKGETVTGLKPTEVEGAVLEDGRYDSSPQFWFQEWFEVLRSFFSGLSKGQKSVDYTLNPLQEVDANTGHYHESRIMLWFTAVLGVVYAVSLALRADARGFGRPDITAPSSPNPALPSSPAVATAGPLEGAGAGAVNRSPIRPVISNGGPTAFGPPAGREAPPAPPVPRRAPISAIVSDDVRIEESGLRVEAAAVEGTVAEVTENRKDTVDSDSDGDSRSRSMSPDSSGGAGVGRSRDALFSPPRPALTVTRRSQSVIPTAALATARGILARVASAGTLLHPAGAHTLPSALDDPDDAISATAAGTALGSV